MRSVVLNPITSPIAGVCCSGHLRFSDADAPGAGLRKAALRAFVVSAAAVLGLIGTQETCVGQTGIHPPSLQRDKGPTTSPYLFLAQPGGNDALNYYRRIRPEQRFRAADNAQANSIHDLQNDIRRIEGALVESTSTIGQTGHQSAFFYYGGYFNSNPGHAGGGRFRR